MLVPHFVWQQLSVFAIQLSHICHSFESAKRRNACTRFFSVQENGIFRLPFTIYNVMKNVVRKKYTLEIIKHEKLDRNIYRSQRNRYIESIYSLCVVTISRRIRWLRNMYTSPCKARRLHLHLYESDALFYPWLSNCFILITSVHGHLIIPVACTLKTLYGLQK